MLELVEKSELPKHLVYKPKETLDVDTDVDVDVETEEEDMVEMVPEIRLREIINHDNEDSL
ncbi:hypothetical protein KI387_026229, partial [Taxus chinensis]